MVSYWFDEVAPRSLAILFALAALWLLGRWGSRARRRWLARFSIGASLVVFLAAWLSSSDLIGFLGRGLYNLLYPANRHLPWVHYDAALAIMLAAANAAGIVGVWAALGRPHWFVGMATIAAISSLLLLIRAYEPCLVFLMQSAVTMTPLLIARSIRKVEPLGRPTALPMERVGSSRFQFRILDLLALALLAATVLGAVLSAPEEFVVHEAKHHSISIVWPSPPSPSVIVALGVVLGLVMLLAAWVTLGRGVWWLRVMGLFLAWPGLVCMAWLVLWREAAGRHIGANPGSATLGLDRNIAFSLRRKVCGTGLTLLSLLILVPLGIVYYHVAVPAPVPDVVFPEPNGYDMLLTASETLDKALRDQRLSLPARSQEASASEVHALRVSNQRIWQAALQEVRVALDRSSRVRFQYRAIEFGRYEFMNDLASTLKIEGKVAASEGRFSDAIGHFSDIIRLGRAAGHGGLVIDWICDSMIEGLGIEQFHNLARSLDAAQCRMAIKALAAEDRDRERLEDVLPRDLVWGARALGWSGRLCLFVGQHEQTARQLHRDSPKRVQAELRIAMTEVAIRAYCLEHGGLPDRLAQLVPNYLPAMPVDPLTDRPPVYELNEQQGYVVYSPKLTIGWAAPPGANR